MHTCVITQHLERFLPSLGDPVGTKVDEWASNPATAAEYLDDLIGSGGWNSDGNTHFSADLTAILLAPESDWDSLAHAWLYRLGNQLRDHMTPFAESEVVDLLDGDVA